MARKTLPYKEGDWFAVPLTNGMWVLGLAARVSRGGGVLGYFFGPARYELPSNVAAQGLTASDAVDICKFGDLGLKNGEWPVISSHKEWNPTSWPMPEFGRVDIVNPTIAYRTAYREDCIEQYIRETVVSPEEALSLPEDCSYGDEALVYHLERLLE